MRCVHSSGLSGLRAQSFTHDFTEAIAPVTDGQQLKRILWSRFAPAARDGFSRFVGGKGSFEFIGGEQDFHEVREDQFPQPARR